MSLGAIMPHLSSKCRRFLAGDGVTTPDFTLVALAGVFEGMSFDARAAKKQAPALGEAFGIAKNLDEYQHRICALVPSLPDSDPAKIRLQKYRIGIMVAFAKLAVLVRTGDAAEWNRHARLLLEEASNAYVASGSGQKPYAADVSGAFSFLGLSEAAVDRALAAMYGTSPQD
jgi:hypothetical protein